MSDENPANKDLANKELEAMFSEARKEIPSGADLAQLREALGSRLDTALPEPPPSPSPSPIPMVASLGVGLVVLAAIAYWGWASGQAPGPHSEPSSRPSAQPAPATAPEQAALEEPIVPSSAPPSVEEAVSSRPSRRSSASRRPSEEDLIGRAQHSLASSPARTLSLAARHLRLYPDGILSQERELLAVDALNRLGRRRAARRRAAQFTSRWPSSPHLRRLHRLVDEPEDPDEE